MSTIRTADETVEKSRNGAASAGRNARHVEGQAKRSESSEMSSLVVDVEELMTQLANVADVDLGRLRDRIKEKLASAKEALTASGARAGKAARNAAGATDEYVQGSPWTAVGIAALAGLLCGYVIARR